MKIWDQKSSSRFSAGNFTRLQNAVLKRDPASELSFLTYVVWHEASSQSYSARQNSSITYFQ